jgi:tetratricopeptide (TPR) repeat protein
VRFFRFFSAISLSLMTVFSSPAHAVCLDKSLPDWVRQLEHLDEGCSRVGQLLPGVKLPPATDAVEPDPADWRGAALVIVHNNAVTLNGIELVPIMKDGRIPDAHRRGQLIIPLLEAAQAQADSAKQVGARTEQTDETTQASLDTLFNEKTPKARAAAFNEAIAAWKQRQANPLVLQKDDPERAKLEALIAPLSQRVEAFKKHKWGATQTEITHMLSAKKNELRLIVEEGSGLVRLNGPDTDAAQKLFIHCAVLTLVGESYLTYADMLYSVPHTPELDEDAYEHLQAAMDAVRYPLEDRAIARLEAVLEQRAKHHVNSPWIQRAMKTLSERYPSEYSNVLGAHPMPTPGPAHPSVAMASLTSASTPLTKSDVPPIMALAKAAIDQHWFTVARALMERAYDLSPDDPQVLNLLAITHMETGGKDVAQKILAHAIEDNPELVFLKMSSLLSLEDIGKAQEQRKELLDQIGEPIDGGWRCLTNTCEAQAKQFERIESNIKRESYKKKRAQRRDPQGQKEDDDFKGQVIFAIDGSLPFATLRQILYTMGQAQFSVFAFAVDDPSPSASGSLKVSAPSGPAPAARPPPLRLSLTITKKGITILGADKVLHPGGLPPVAPGHARPVTTPCPEGGCETVADYDWAELKRLLVKIKKMYPTELTYVVLPSEDTSHTVLTRTIDISRSYTVNGETQPLFPWVIIAGGNISDAGGTESGAGGPVISTQLPVPAATVSPAMRLAIFTSCLPAIGPPRAAGAPAPAPKAFEGAVDGRCGETEFEIEAEPAVLLSPGP